MYLPAAYEVYIQGQVCDAHNISNRQGVQLFFFLSLLLQRIFSYPLKLVKLEALPETCRYLLFCSCV